MEPPKLIQSPLNPGWLIPEGWDHILGFQIDYRLGQSILHLWQVQWNQHVSIADGTDSHSHPHHQLLYYQRGEGHLLTSGEKYLVKKGSIFFVPADCLHSFISDNAEPALCLALDFTVADTGFGTLDIRGLPTDSEDAVLLSLLHAHNARPFHLRAMDQIQVEACIGSIREENDRKELGYASMIHAHLLRLISLCLRATQRAQGFGAHFQHTAWRHMLIAERAQTLIRENATRPGEGLTLSETARACAVSPNQLNRILKRHAGQTFHQTLLQRRLDHAAELLRSGKANCTEAAFEAGFNDSNYFSRAFRKVFGHAPSLLSQSS
jgi:AraC family L-rhamnose operon regulatory protein RhaS